MPVSVNLSPRQIEKPGFVDDVRQILAQTGLPAHALTLEITEGVLMGDTEASIATLRALKQLGVKLAIDDFGTGYSSLSYLQRLPVDSLKIDRSFVATLNTGGADAALVRSIIAIGDALGLETVAEGIEEAAQLQALISLGVGFGQGYYFSRPLSVAAMSDLLGEFDRSAHAAKSSPCWSRSLIAIHEFSRGHILTRFRCSSLIGERHMRMKPRSIGLAIAMIAVVSVVFVVAGQVAGQDAGLSRLIELEAVKSSGVSGTVTLTDVGGGRTRIEVQVDPAGNLDMPSHIHPGVCGDMKLNFLQIAGSAVGQVLIGRLDISSVLIAPSTERE